MPSRLAPFAFAAILTVQPAVATTPAPLGSFGVWEAWSSPTMLRRVGHPMGKIGASISAYGKAVRWNVDVRTAGYTVTTQDKHCHQRATLPIRGTSAATLVEVLKKQTAAARNCSRRVSPEAVERLNFSKNDLQRALQVVLPLVRR